MIDSLYALGRVVKENRLKQGLTQDEVAELAEIDSQTVRHIENFKTDPKLSVVSPLIRALHIDPQGVYYPELEQAQGALSELECLLADRSEDQIRALFPVIRASLDLLDAKDYTAVK